MVKKPRKLNKGQSLIMRFITPEAWKDNRSFWPREMKIASKLLKEYEYDFLISMPKPFGGKFLDSLCWFISSSGQEYLLVRQREYKTLKTCQSMAEENQKTNTIDLTSAPKVGEDIKPDSNKPKTLQDFLKLYATPT
jgi:hypothetical protein